MQKTYALGEGEEGNRKLGLKSFGYKLPRESITQTELQRPSVPGPANSSLCSENVANGFHLWHKALLQKEPATSNPRPFPLLSAFEEITQQLSDSTVSMKIYPLPILLSPCASVWFFVCYLKKKIQFINVFSSICWFIFPNTEKG